MAKPASSRLSDTWQDRISQWEPLIGPRNLRSITGFERSIWGRWFSMRRHSDKVSLKIRAMNCSEPQCEAQTEPAFRGCKQAGHQGRERSLVKVWQANEIKIWAFSLPTGHIQINLVHPFEIRILKLTYIELSKPKVLAESTLEPSRKLLAAAGDS